MTESLHYVRVGSGEVPPDVARLAPFRAVVVITEPLSPDREDVLADWLVTNGCLYMMAWGPGCSRMDDAVDYANCRKFNFEEIPEREFVMTTWHENEALDETFWYAGFCARDPFDLIRSTLIVDLSAIDREVEMLDRFKAAQSPK